MSVYKRDHIKEWQLYLDSVTVYICIVFLKSFYERDVLLMESKIFLYTYIRTYTYIIYT